MLDFILTLSVCGCFEVMNLIQNELRLDDKTLLTRSAGSIWSHQQVHMRTTQWISFVKKSSMMHEVRTVCGRDLVVILALNVRGSGWHDRQQRGFGSIDDAPYVACNVVYLTYKAV